MGSSIQLGLGIYYLLVVLLNAAFVVYWAYFAKDRKQTTIWSVVTAIFLLHAVLYFVGKGPALPEGLKEFTTTLMGRHGGQAGPILYVMLSVIAFIALLRFRKFFAMPVVAWAVLDLTLLAAGWSITDKEFRLIVTKEDNVPIVLLI